jgi:hypothetical protein
MTDAGPPVGRVPRAALLRIAYAVGAAFVILLSVESLAVLVADQTPPLSESLASVETANGSIKITLEVRAGAAPIQVHAGLVPGILVKGLPIYVFADARYPGPFATYTQIREIGERLMLGLPQTSFIDDGELLQLIQSGSPGVLLVLGGLVPDTVMSNSTALLANWVHDGGLLVWAGGPLGFDEGHPSPPGPFNWESMGWAGQDILAGFPLTDPGVPGPLLAANPTSLSKALGTTYDGTPAGANVTRLADHGGIVLGLTSGPGPGGSSPRAAIAYLPVGVGGILFFGGSFAAATTPQEFVPNADFGLSSDLALLMGTGFLPAFGSTASANVLLPAFESRSIVLAVPATEASVGLAVVVTSPGIPTLLALWSTTAVVPTALALPVN